MRNFVVCHYAKCYGPPVNYTTHIERKKADGSEHIPYNIKRSDLTKHNREFIAEARKIGRTAAIEKRLMAVKHQKDKEGNEYERKIRKDQVCCIEIRLSASPDAMAEIIERGQLIEWCRESVKWAQQEHGKENIVSAVLHMDEETPHLHVSLVPVVQGESKKQATTKKRAAKDKEKAESEGLEAPKKKRRYKKKADNNTLRLCADDIMTKAGLKRRQTEYAEAMEKFGLRRGEENSPARHKDLAEYYKEHCEEMHARLNEVLEKLSQQEILIDRKDSELKQRDLIIQRQEQEIASNKVEIEEKKAEISRQQQELNELTPLVQQVKEDFNTYSVANEFFGTMELSANRLLEAADSREKEVTKIEEEAIDRINHASISFFAKKDVERLSKENAELKLLISRNNSEMEKNKADIDKERLSREKAEKNLQQLQDMISGSQSALERRHPVEARLLRELISIQITEPELQDMVLRGDTLRLNPYPFRDPATGKKIPDEYLQPTEIRMEGKGKDSFISICGKRIADFFRDIWAKVAAALNFKKKQHEEQPRIQTPKKGGMKL